jgi:hypothetical protein
MLESNAEANPNFLVAVAVGTAFADRSPQKVARR